MPEYISREAAIKRLSSWREVIKENFGENDEYAICLEEAMDKIEDLPAADVREVRRGRWITKPHKMMGDSPCCSECGAFEPMERNFCPNCGASMILKEEDYEDG